MERGNYAKAQILLLFLILILIFAAPACPSRAGIVFSEEEPLVTIKLHGVPLFMRDASFRNADAPGETSASAKPAMEAIKETLKKPSPEAPIKTLIEASTKTPESPAAEKSGSAENVIKTLLDSLTESSPGELAPLIAVRSMDLAALPPLVLPPPVKPRPRPSAKPGDTVAPDKMLWPVDGKVTSGFGRRGKRGFHHGIDIPMPKGTSIRAARAGVVEDVGAARDRRYRGYGNVVVLNHGDGIVTMYAHCQSVAVKKGQSVERGDVVGTVGDTGRSTTNHLHFEIRKNGKAVNPIPYLPAH